MRDCLMTQNKLRTYSHNSKTKTIIGIVVTSVSILQESMVLVTSAEPISAST